MMNDLENNGSLREDLIPSKKSLKESTSSCDAWKLFLAASLLCFWGSFMLAPSYIPTVALSSSAALNENDDSSSVTTKWHIKPIKPYHHGRVVFLTEQTDDGVVYKREFTAPCGDGMLVFSIGPAAEYEPFFYDLYDDAYAYSNNQGLCVLYPSYKGIQTSDSIMWEPTDPTELEVDLGDLPNKISSRIVKRPSTKDATKRGGDFLIIRGGNFYNPTYYKHLKGMINGWPADADIEAKMEELIAALE
jgi:hypothetical protein